MPRYRIEGVAKGVGLQALWDWYTDFRPDDVDIVNREAPQVAGVFANRRVRRDGSRILIEQVVHYAGREFPATVEVSLHPERFTYDTVHRVRDRRGRPLMVETRQYKLEGTSAGTRVLAECVIRETHGKARAVNLLGLFTRMARTGSQQVMDGFIKGAERALTKVR